VVPLAPLHVHHLWFPSSTVHGHHHWWFRTVPLAILHVQSHHCRYAQEVLVLQGALAVQGMILRNFKQKISFGILLSESDSFMAADWQKSKGGAFDKLTTTVTTATTGFRVFGVHGWFVIFSRVVMDRRYRVLFRFSRAMVTTVGSRVVRFLWRPFMFTTGRGRVVRLLWRRPFMVTTGGSRVVRFLWRSFMCRVPTAAAHRRFGWCRVHWWCRV
jgi:hypothetical protein